MSYEYSKERPFLFTEDGQVMFLHIRDNVKRLLDDAGAFQAEKSWKGVTGSCWSMLACLDRLVELGEIKEISMPDAWGQDRTFISAKH